jgi:catechol 2,3-dioxygenase-like lactoylglutathione lyase family enzyme
MQISAASVLAAWQPGMTAQLGDLVSVTLIVPDVGIADTLFGDILRMQRSSCRASIPFGASTEHSAHGQSYSAPGWNRGRIRVVEGPARGPRSGLIAGWDCVELAVADVDGVVGRLGELGEGDLVFGPITVDLSAHGSAQHRSAVWRAPWGTHVILTAGVTQPKGRVFPAPRAGDLCGPVFEVHLRAAAACGAARFYQQVLGMRILMRMDVTDGPIHDVWDIPNGTSVDMVMVTGRGEGTGNGAIEIQAHDPAVIGTPPYAPSELFGGTSVVSYGCPDLKATSDMLSRRGFEWHRSGESLWVRGPVGEWLELVSEANTAV